MNQLTKLNIGILKYLEKELKKKRTLKELILFLKQAGKIYFQQLLKLYKNLFLVFDKDYQAKKKEYDKYQKIKVDLQRCLKILQYVDTKLEKAGINRQRRRQFWRDFYSRGQVRKDVFDDLLKELSQIK